LGWWSRRLALGDHSHGRDLNRLCRSLLSRNKHTPKGSTYFKPKKTGSMEVTSRGDFILYAILQAPLALAWLAGMEARSLCLDMLSPALTNSIYAGLASLYAYQLYDMWRINAPVMRGEIVPEIHRYKFRQVVVLSVAYFVTFGSELAVVSFCPCCSRIHSTSLWRRGICRRELRLDDLFREAGGRLAQRPLWPPTRNARRHGGAASGYFAMSFIGAATGVAFAVAATFCCSLFVNAGNGAVYAMLPLIKRRLTGQIAGIVGAFGNVGGVLFLTFYSFVTPHVFFLSGAIAAVWVSS